MSLTHRLTTYAQIHELQQKEVSGLEWLEELRRKIHNNELTKETLELAKKVLEEWEKIAKQQREKQRVLWQNYSGTPICVDCYRVEKCILSPTSACSLYRKSSKGRGLSPRKQVAQKPNLLIPFSPRPETAKKEAASRR